MTETLLSPSNVLLFGREVDDLQIIIPPPIGLRSVRLASAPGDNITIPGSFPKTLDGRSTNGITRIFLKDQINTDENGFYLRNKNDRIEKDELPAEIEIYYVSVNKGSDGNLGIYKVDNITGAVTKNPPGDKTHSPFAKKRKGLESQLLGQIDSSKQPSFARIYAFSFEGYYYELPRPVLFLVHGEGVSASEARTGLFGRPRQARAPGDPSLTGIGQADFQFSDDIMVWSYDKADYTIRMDVETGMFEDVLLAAMLGGGPGGMEAAGMSARGMSARGMSARGMSARGMSARGMSARGGNNSD